MQIKTPGWALAVALVSCTADAEPSDLAFGTSGSWEDESSSATDAVELEPGDSTGASPQATTREDSESDSGESGEDPTGVPAGEPGPAYRVEGSTLHDPCGEPLTLRGVNKESAFPAGDENQALMAEVAKTGANAVRITLRMEFNNSDGQDLRIAAEEAVKNHMVLVPAIWDATGDWDRLDEAASFWFRSDVLPVLKEYEQHIIVNIANEAGRATVTDEEYRTRYAEIVQRFRDEGLRMPLMIDAAHWGRDESYLLDNGQALLDADPEHNLVFSWHPWDPEQPASRYASAFETAKEKELTLVVGEIAQLDVEYRRPIDYRSLLRLANEHDVGWLWWWWRSTDAHSMTTDGIYGNWANAGEEVVVGSEDGIQATSQRTLFQLEGRCE